MFLLSLLKNLKRRFNHLRYDRQESVAELRARHIQGLYQQLQLDQTAIYCSKEELEAIKNKRLRALLLYAKSKSPWYKKTLAKIDIEYFTQERLNELPIINKAILMEHWDEIVTNPKLSLALVEKHLSKKSDRLDNLYLFSRYHVSSTGGSSGKRGIFIHDWDEYIMLCASFLRYPRYNYECTQLVLEQLNGKPTIVSLFVTNTAVFAYSFSMTFRLLEDNLYFLPMAVTPLNLVITRLNQLMPDIISGSPSYVHKICQLVQKRQIKIEPKIIFVCAEPLFEETEALIKETWPKIHLFNAFGCMEGITGIPCRANSNELHLNEDFCIVEPLNEQSQLVDKGVMASKVYLTNLYNYTLPLIRYENADDILFLDKNCTCGSPHQLILAPRGRPGCDFNYPGNIFVHHSLFLGPLLLEKNIQEYQVEQTMMGANIKIVSTGYIDKQKLQKTICSRLAKVGLFDAQINIIEVPKITYLFSGKLNRFMPLKDNAR